METVILSPELLSTVVNNGLGFVAIALLLRLNNRVDRAVAVLRNHEHRIVVVERKTGTDDDVVLPEI